MIESVKIGGIGVAKFNLNQLLSKTSLSNTETEKEEPMQQEQQKKKAYEIKLISVYDLVPSKDNFYSLNQIDELKTAIELAGGIKQNLNVVPLENNKYKVLAGHRRRLASLALAEEGKAEYELLPCKVEETQEDKEIQTMQEELLIILTNSHREKTDYDKVEEVKRLREILEKYKEKEKIPGRMREIIAEALNTSPGQVGRMESIDRKLSDGFKEELKEEKINISTAYELSTLPEEGQQEIFEEYKEKGSLSINDVKEKKIEIKEEEQLKQIKEKDIEPTKQDKSIGSAESTQDFITIHQTIKEMDIEELAAFICGRCDIWGRFCGFAIECNHNEGENRIDICARWLKMQTGGVAKDEEESN